MKEATYFYTQFAKVGSGIEFTYEVCHDENLNVLCMVTVKSIGVEPLVTLMFTSNATEEDRELISGAFSCVQSLYGDCMNMLREYGQGESCTLTSHKEYGQMIFHTDVHIESDEKGNVAPLFKK